MLWERNTERKEDKEEEKIEQGIKISDNGKQALMLAINKARENF